MQMKLSRQRHGVGSGLAVGILLIVGSLAPVPARGEPKTDLHYSPNHNFDDQGQYLPGKVGFNLADVGDVRKLESLPDGVKGLVWIGQCNGVDETFLKTVQPFLGHPKVFGFYLMDEPDPTGRYNSLCTPDNLRAESDWIHAHAADAKTFIVLMSLGSSEAPSFLNTYNPANSHIDLFGIDPYPCRTEVSSCDYEMIDRHVAAADAWGIPRRDIVPVYQAFGGGDWKDDRGGKYVLPTVEQIEQMMERWGSFVPAPTFDYAYSWGIQSGDEPLESSPDLKAVFARHNKQSRP
jgi:hypothetical protein